MTTDVITASPETSISNIVDIIYQYGFHGLPVVENKKVTGIITEDDFFLKNYDDLYLPAYIRFIRENKIASSLTPEIKEKIGKILFAKARDLMTANPIAVSPEMEITELMNLIKKTKFVTFPVVDENKNILGVVTLADILGTVKKGTLEMRKAMRGQKEIEGLAKELDSLWKEEFVVVSKKKVKTWKGIFFITLFTMLGGIILLAYYLKGYADNKADQKNFYPLPCQFTYSDWSQCQADGMQTRKIINKLPDNCEGGFPEAIARRCQ